MDRHPPVHAIQTTKTRPILASPDVGIADKSPLSRAGSSYAPPLVFVGRTKFDNNPRLATIVVLSVRRTAPAISKKET
jgi:hypothetical protein